MSRVNGTAYLRLEEKIFLKKIERAYALLKECVICPRRCREKRLSKGRGFCNASGEIEVAHWQLHFGEEPPLSSSGGAGTIFFQHCNLKCVYCQNFQISQGLKSANILSAEALGEIMLNLQKDAAENIDLVSPTHFMPQIIKAVYLAREKGLNIPIVYNTNGYETAQALELLDGIIDIYLPDIKYTDNGNASLYSQAGDYAQIAQEAIILMHRQAGDLVLDETGKALRGVLVRHLVLPENISGSFRALDFLKDSVGLNVGLSLMSQYAPCYLAGNFPRINRSINAGEYAAVVDYAQQLGFRRVWIQEIESSGIYLPDFDSEKVFGKTTDES